MDGWDRREPLPALFRRELKVACAASGLTQRQIADRAGISPSQLSRILTGRVVPSLDATERLAHSIGHRVTVRLIPERGVRLRDSGQVAVAGLISQQAHASFQVRLEVPVARPPDLRAADMVLENQGAATIVEIERWLRDLQAQLRRAQLKRSAYSELIGRRIDLVVALMDTPANRRIIEPHSSLVTTALPLGSRRIWAAIRSGEALNGDGLLWIRP